ncbi:MAG: hypothetical protein LBM75_04965 [Myxococcales bacterium]|jgi:hypothetical protein|nr:hypothetical protein [Myxococcales bacterium]
MTPMTTTFRTPWLWLPLLLLSACATTSTPVAPVIQIPTTAPTHFPVELQRQHLPEDLVEDLDLDGDEKPDMWRYARIGADGGAKYVRKEIDLNHDGLVDVWRYYSERGELFMEAFDFDFDTRIDQINFYEKGAISQKKRDLSGSGKTDVWVYYDQGKISRKERDSTGNGKIDYWEYWEDGRVSRIGEDLDGDGEVDRWSKAENDADAADGGSAGAAQ